MSRDEYSARMTERTKVMVNAIIEAMKPYAPADLETASEAAKEFALSTAVALMILARFYGDGFSPAHRMEILRLSLEMRRKGFPKVSDDDGKLIPDEAAVAELWTRAEKVEGALIELLKLDVVRHREDCEATAQPILWEFEPVPEGKTRRPSGCTCKLSGIFEGLEEIIDEAREELAEEMDAEVEP